MAEELTSKQLGLMKKINKELDVTNKLLIQERKLIGLVNLSLNDNLAGFEGFITQVNTELDKLGIKSSKQLRTASEGPNQLRNNLKKPIKGKIEIDANDADSAAQRAMALADATSDALTASTHDTRQFYEEAQRIFGGTMDYIDAENAQAGKFLDITAQALAAFDLTPLEQQMQGVSLADFFGDADTYLRQFTATSENAVVSISFLENATAKTPMILASANKAYGLNTSQLATFIQRQQALTGNATTEMLEESIVYADKVSAATGVSRKFIIGNMEKIIAKTNTFGNILPAEAAKISHELLQLGIRFEDLEGIVSKFQSFESAAQSVGDLTSVFGVHLDTVELMMLANTDQGNFASTLREQFLSQGVALDQMNLAQKKVLMTALGAQDIEVVEKFFSDDSLQSLEDAEAAISDVTPEDLGKSINIMAKDMLLAHKSTEGFADYLKTKFARSLTHSFSRPLNAAAVNLDRFKSKVGTSFTKTTMAPVTGVLDSLNDILKASPEDVTKLAGSVEKLTDSTVGFVKALTTGDITKASESFKSIFAAFDFTAQLKTAFSTAMSEITGHLTALVADMKKALAYITKKNSPSQFGQDIVDGILPIGTALENDVPPMFKKMGELSAKALSETDIYPHSTPPVAARIITAFEESMGKGGEVATEALFNNMKKGIVKGDKVIFQSLTSQKGFFSDFYNSLEKQGVRYGKVDEETKRKILESTSMSDKQFEVLSSKSTRRKIKQMGVNKELAATIARMAQGQSIDQMSEKSKQFMENVGVSNSSLEGVLTNAKSIDSVYKDIEKKTFDDIFGAQEGEGGTVQPSTPGKPGVGAPEAKDTIRTSRSMQSANTLLKETKSLIERLPDQIAAGINKSKVESTTQSINAVLSIPPGGGDMVRQKLITALIAGGGEFNLLAKPPD